MSMVIGKFKPSKNHMCHLIPEWDFSVVTKLDCDGLWWCSGGYPGFKGVQEDGTDYHVFGDMWDFVPA